LGTCASRRNATLPAPPSPALTCRPHSSTNAGIRPRYENGCAPPRLVESYCTRRTGSPPMLAPHVVVSLACAPFVYDIWILNQQLVETLWSHVYDAGTLTFTSTSTPLNPFG